MQQPTTVPDATNEALRHRQELIADTTRSGMRVARDLSESTDTWLQLVWTQAAADTSSGKPLALVAIGGYGRGDLAPFSDLDLLLVHDGVKDIDAVASRLWYPIWDAGVKLGHAVGTVKQVLELARTELDTATALLTVRHIAVDASL
ncbi:MAG: nucleotidyltransferase domain-containing protein, partial [Actinomycetota bacterium]